MQKIRIKKHLTTNNNKDINTRTAQDNDITLYSIGELQAMAAGYVSWYNYPLCLTKNIQGYITQL